MSSPSKIRREGRNAYFRGGVSADFNPYRGSGLFAQGKAADWNEGWMEAYREDQAAIAAQEKADLEEFDKVVEFARLYNMAKKQGLLL